MSDKWWYPWMTTWDPAPQVDCDTSVDTIVEPPGFCLTANFEAD